VGEFIQEQDGAGEADVNVSSYGGTISGRIVQRSKFLPGGKP
jgi:hypothetical protein